MKMASIKWNLLCLAYLFFSLERGNANLDKLGEKLKNIDVMCTKTHAIITYVGDPKAVIAFGEDGLCMFDAVTTEAKYTLIATFQKRSPSDCVMKKHPHMNIYHIEVEARFTAPDMEAEGDETAVLSCNFEVMLTSQAQTIQLEDPIVVPIIVEDEHAPKAESKMIMEVHLEDGKVLPTESVVGTDVELTAVMESAPGEMAFQVLLCYADMNEAKLSVPIVVDGCGTGHPFAKDQGFVRYNLFAKSPSFGLFRAAKAQEVQFRCEFLICPDNCDMFSCPAEREKTMRRRRSLGQEIEVSSKLLWAQTEPRKVFLRGEARKKKLDYNDLVIEEWRNMTDPLWNRLVNEQVKVPNNGGSTAVFPKNLLALIIVGGILVICVVTGLIWGGWRYATRSVNITVTPRRVIREISSPRPYLPPNSVDPTGAYYDLAL